jgi:glycosyltransferase involved in cell wall biosynthesis
MRVFTRFDYGLQFGSGGLQMGTVVPIAVIIPTYNRGKAVLSLLEKIHEFDPAPSEIWVHIDLGDTALERELKHRLPRVRVLASPVRLGPGGGRHRCLLACNTPYAVSFDDDSHPVDSDFFASVQKLFFEHPEAAIFGASIWHRHEPIKIRTEKITRAPDYVGCGYAIRLSAYRQVRGYLPRPSAYGMEESDLSLQLFAVGWEIYIAANLRVFHDTDLAHHQSSEVTSGVITNIGLFAYLNYPIIGLGWGLVQVANKVFYCIRMGRFRGICSGILQIPVDCYRYRSYRNPIAWKTIKEYLRFRRKSLD